MKKYFNIILNILIFLSLCTLALIVYDKLAQKDLGDEKYQTGLEFYKQEDYQNAYYNFARVPKNSPYYYIALFRQGMCAEKLGDFETQAEKFEEFSKYKENKLTLEAQFKSGIAYFYLKDYSNAKKIFKKAINIPEIDNKPQNFAIASNYFLAEIAKNDSKLKDAVKYYLEYLKYAQDGKYSLKSAEELNSILENNSDISLNEEEKFLIAKTFFYGEKYNNTDTFLINVPDEKAWWLKGLTNIKFKNNEEAIKLFELGLKNYYSDLDEKNLENIIDEYIKISPLDKKSSLRQLETILNGTNNPIKAYVYYELDEYRKIFEENLKGKYAANSLYSLIFEAYNNKDYNLVKSYVNAYLSRFPNMQGAPKVLYFLAKSLETTHKQLEANQAYNRLIAQYPDTYWAFRAYSKLHPKKSKLLNWIKLDYYPIKIKEKTPLFPYSAVSLSQNDAELLNDLIKIKDYDVIEKIDNSNLALRSWTNYMSGNYSLSVVQARDYIQDLEVKPDFQDDLYTLAYPIMYKNEINKYSELNNLNAYLMQALIREESYFNPKAKSHVGALGLMQLMPDTANFIHNAPVTKNQLFTPEFNISLGTKYYNYTKKLLNNNNIYAILAYNGGPGAVQKWIKKHETKDIDEFIENVPFDETQNYVVKIYKSYWNYLNIYQKDKI